MGTENGKTDLQGQIDQLKATVKVASDHPFVPAPAREAIIQATAIIELISVQLHAIVEVLGEDLDLAVTAKHLRGG